MLNAKILKQSLPIEIGSKTKLLKIVLIIITIIKIVWNSKPSIGWKQKIRVYFIIITYIIDLLKFLAIVMPVCLLSSTTHNFCFFISLFVER